MEKKFEKYKSNEMPCYTDIVYSLDHPDKNIPGKVGTIWFCKDGRVFTFDETYDQPEGWYEFCKADAKFLQQRLYNRVESWCIDWKLFPHSTQFDYIERDRKYIGTNKYLGHAYFWDCEYKHYLRYRQPRTLVKIHDALLKEGLKVCGVSDKHEEIIKKLTKHLKD